MVEKSFVVTDFICKYFYIKYLSVIIIIFNLKLFMYLITYAYFLITTRHIRFKCLI